LPEEVLIATLQDHQRYFPMRAAGRRLLARFITISNLDSPEPAGRSGAATSAWCARGWRTPHFSYQQDRRSPLKARSALLDSVVFQAKLGSIGEKSRRVAALPCASLRLARRRRLGGERAAQLAKCDLVTAMVGEFPELQGIMGRYYALADGRQPEVATAIEEQYLPRFAGDRLPATRTGQALALADKLDTIAGIFVIGQRPTGNRDPFGIRRAALGVLRILIECELDSTCRPWWRARWRAARSCAADCAATSWTSCTTGCAAITSTGGAVVAPHDAFEAVLARSRHRWWTSTSGWWPCWSSRGSMPRRRWRRPTSGSPTSCARPTARAWRT
jgi:glycyl-tRNA synthetase beta chain